MRNRTIRIIQNRICKDYINSLPIIEFKGEIITVNSMELLEKSIKKLKKEKMLGFDTESRPSFKKGISYPISLIQLASKKRVYLLQLKKLPDISALNEIFKSNKIMKIGVDTDSDLMKLKLLYNFETNNFVDIGQMAKVKGIIQFGAKNLSSRYLQQRISKASQTSNWAKDKLTGKQMKYAATDAWICLKIYPHLIRDKINYKNFQ
jgi:ribonuclease D